MGKLVLIGFSLYASTHAAMWFLNAVEGVGKRLIPGGGIGTSSSKLSQFGGNV
jgi:hypothetical protein